MARGDFDDSRDTHTHTAHQNTRRHMFFSHHSTRRHISGFYYNVTNKQKRSMSTLQAGNNCSGPLFQCTLIATHTHTHTYVYPFQVNVCNLQKQTCQKTISLVPDFRMCVCERVCVYSVHGKMRRSRRRIHEITST